MTTHTYFPAITESDLWRGYGLRKAPHKALASVEPDAGTVDQPFGAGADGVSSPLATEGGAGQVTVCGSVPAPSRVNGHGRTNGKFMSITSAQYNDMLARLNRNAVREAPTETTPDEGREKTLHERILWECARRRWLVVHSRMDVPATCTPGTPDFIIMRNGGPSRTLWIECKRKGEKLTVEQMGFAQWAATLGVTVHIVRSFEHFLNLIDQ